MLKKGPRKSGKNLNYGNINYIVSKLPLLIVITLLFISGCKTTTGYKQIMQTWQGATELELIRTIGAPNSTHTSNGIKFLVYDRSYTTKKSYYSSYDFDNYGGSGYSYPIGGDTYSCITTYELENGIITNIKWVGNNCKAKEKEENKDAKPAKVKKINEKSYDDYVF
jgi:hypothetical protein